MAEAVALAPRLFSLCGCAQGAAARLAAAAAEGRDEAGEAHTLMIRSIVLEAIGEHLWRLLPTGRRCSAARRKKSTFSNGASAYLRYRQSGCLPEEVLALAADLRAWLAGRLPGPFCGDRSHAPLVTLLPWCSAEDWAAVVIDDAFAQAPTLGGESAETGALARQSDVPEVTELLADDRRVAACIAARWADLDFLADGSSSRVCWEAGWIAPVGPGVGLARSKPRGPLLHLMQVRTAGGALCYRRPTEWNFPMRRAPSPARSSVLRRRRATRRKGWRGDWRWRSIPCVSYEVRSRMHEMSLAEGCRPDHRRRRPRARLQ